MAPKTKPDPKDFMVKGKKGEKILREPGSLMGYDFVIDGCEGCEFRLLDNTSQVQVDECKDCKILIGPVGGSVFVRNCERCVIFTACQQLRTRECIDCDILLIIPGTPIIEMSKNLRFGPLPMDLYPEFQAQLPKPLIDKKNEWHKIYDFSPNDPPGGGHWSLLNDDESAAIVSSFSARPGEASTKEAASAAGTGQELPELKVSATTGSRRCAEAARRLFAGLPEREDAPPRMPVKRVAVAGVGPAIAVAAAVASILESEDSAKIVSVATDLIATSGDRQAPRLRIVLEGK